MSQFQFFDEVRIRPSAKPELASLVGRLGAVLGISGPAELPTAYAIAVDGLAHTIMLAPPEIEATGQRRDRADYCDGSSLRVSMSGEALDATSVRATPRKPEKL